MTTTAAPRCGQTINPTGAMQKYKQNLSVMYGLYSSLERRILEHFAKMRDLKITLAFPLHMRQKLGEERFLEFVRETYNGHTDEILDAIEYATEIDEERVTLAHGNQLLLSQLVRDGFIKLDKESVRYVDDVPIVEDFVLTDAGKDFVDAPSSCAVARVARCRD
jgi:hypothetical protein